MCLDTFITLFIIFQKFVINKNSQQHHYWNSQIICFINFWLYELFECFLSLILCYKIANSSGENNSRSCLRLYEEAKNETRVGRRTGWIKRKTTDRQRWIRERQMFLPRSRRSSIVWHVDLRLSRVAITTFFSFVRVFRNPEQLFTIPMYYKYAGANWSTV